MTVKLKTIVKNNFWILEQDGTKVGTVSKKDKKNYQLLSLHQDKPVTMTMTDIINKWGEDCFKEPVKVDVEKSITTAGEVYLIFGYPCASKPTNEMYDVQRKLPLFTKSAKSKSLYCEGYYIIHFDKGWVKSFCPKLITVERYETKGPFKTEIEMRQELSRATN